MTADVSDLRRLAAVLEEHADQAGEEMRAVVTRGALNVKTAWRANAVATAGRHARAYPYSVSYDVHPLPGGAVGEIGPDKGRTQGALGNILEYGTARQGGHNDGGRALAEEEPRFTAQVTALGDRLGRL